MLFQFPPSAIPLFCDRCGGPIVNAEEASFFEMSTGEAPKPFRCAKGHERWMSPQPVAVLALIIDGTWVPLGRRGIHPAFGKLALPAGFSHPGEDMEVAARREVREEMGVVIPADAELIPLRDKASPTSLTHMTGFAFNWITSLYGPCHLKPDGKEVTEILQPTIDEVPELAFPIHRLMLDRALDTLWRRAA